MRFKKFLISALAAMCALSLLIPAAYAHGCHGQSTGTRRYGCAVCTVEDCTLGGRHVHGRTIYCGYDHESGWCDGSCPLYQTPAYSGVRYGGHCRSRCR